MATSSALSEEGGNGTDGDAYFCEVFDFSTINGALFIFIFIISVIANCLLLCIVVAYESLKNVTNIFVLNLACSDLVFTATLPFWGVYHLQQWIFGDFWCKFMTAAYFVGLYSSVILLTAMTVDRFVTVVLHNYPSNHVGRKRCLVGACVGAWVISIAASLSDAISVGVEEDSFNNYTCEVSSDGSDSDVAYYLQASLLFFLPFAIIVICYSGILKTVVQASNRKRHRTVVVVLFIVAAFFVCWGPYNFLLFIKTLYEPESCEAENRLHFAFEICRIFAFSHCFMNPLLYMLSQKMRRHLLHLLRLESMQRKHSERSTTAYSTYVQNAVYTAQTSVVTFARQSNRGSLLK